MNTAFPVVAVLFVATVLSAACSGPGPANNSSDPAAATTSAAVTPEDIARQVVARHTGIEPDATELVSIQFREFRDSSLDCPSPDRAYLQVITPGHQAIVRAGGRDFDVRVAGGNGRICERPQPATRTRKAL